MQRSARAHHILRLLRIAAAVMLLWFNPADTTAEFRVTTPIRAAYDQIMALKLDAARLHINAIREADPSNLLAVYLEDYLDFFTLFIGENRADYERLLPNRSTRLAALKDGDEDSPYYLYTQAEVHVHWAMIKFKFEENLSAARDINRAFRLLKRNERWFPDFAPNLKSLGMLRAGVGTIPDKYKWAVRLLSSLEGTIGEGLADLRRALDLGERSDTFTQNEAHIFYAMALLHFGNDGDAAWKHLQDAPLRPAARTVDCFVLANVAMKTRRVDAAIDLLTNRPRDAGIHPFPYLDFTLGLAKLYRTDPDADAPLKRYVRTFKGINYIKEAYQKIAWHYLIHGDREGYQRNMTLCRTQGAAVTDEDKHALEEAQSGRVPHPQLLRARLLFDGGAFDRALTTATSIQRTALSPDHELEYTYRLGRIYHALQRHEEALRYYDETITSGSSAQQYYACNAALQAGLIHEAHQRYDLAAQYYRTCLSLRPSDYQSSLHQKAKSGLNRIGIRK